MSTSNRASVGNFHGDLNLLPRPERFSTSQSHVGHLEVGVGKAKAERIEGGDLARAVMPVADKHTLLILDDFIHSREVAEGRRVFNSFGECDGKTARGIDLTSQNIGEGMTKLLSWEPAVDDSFYRIQPWHGDRRPCKYDDDDLGGRVCEGLNKRVLFAEQKYVVSIETFGLIVLLSMS